MPHGRAESQYSKMAPGFAVHGDVSSEHIGSENTHAGIGTPADGNPCRNAAGDRDLPCPLNAWPDMCGSPEHFPRLTFGRWSPHLVFNEVFRSHCKSPVHDTEVFRYVQTLPYSLAAVRALGFGSVWNWDDDNPRGALDELKFEYQHFREVHEMSNDENATDVASPKTLAEAARVSPTHVFASPADVVRSDELTKKEKLRILEQWEADAIALQTATDEGMSGGKRPRLDEVKAAQTELRAKTTPTSP